jgi:hypothetical protein
VNEIASHSAGEAAVCVDVCGETNDGLFGRAVESHCFAEAYIFLLSIYAFIFSVKSMRRRQRLLRVKYSSHAAGEWAQTNV